MLEVIEPGPLATIQDHERHGAALGVPAGGACDRTALGVLRALMEGPAAVEMTLVGATFAVRRTGVVGLAGADFGAVIAEEGRSLTPGTAVLVHAGTTLRFGPGGDGARAYLSLAGGIEVPEVLGSRSTCLAGGFGGCDGRPLRPGDVLTAGEPARLDLAGRRWPGAASGALPGSVADPVRVVLGPHVQAIGTAALDVLLEAEWTVDPRSDRMGLRLGGPPFLAEQDGGLLSLPMVQGAVQLPPGGEPIILLADHQTVGGYPVPLVVASVDHPRLAQLRPGDRLRFEGITLDEAFRLRLEERERVRDMEDAFSRAPGGPGR